MNYTTISTHVLDREIAEREGWHPEQRGEGWIWRNGDKKWTAPEAFYTTADGVWDYLYVNEDFLHYTTDLNVAWKLTEPYFFKLVPLYTGDGKVGCIAELSEGEKIGNGRAETPALAICLAYLELKATSAPGTSA